MIVVIISIFISFLITDDTSRLKTALRLLVVSMKCPSESVGFLYEEYDVSMHPLLRCGFAS